MYHKMMTKTWLKEAGIADVGAFFSLEDKDVSFFHKLMIKFCDGLVKMQIIKITFK